MDAEAWLALPLGERQRLLRNYLEDPEQGGYDFLDLVHSQQYGIYASIGPDYRFAVFGRDSLEVAEDLLAYDQALAQTIILTLARLQGTHHDDVTEEEPGKILHEFRSIAYDQVTVPPYSQELLHALQKQWGREGSDTLLYYGSFDATPLYIRLIDRYCRHYSTELLNHTYFDKDGHEQTIATSVRQGTQWLLTKLDQSPSGLLEFKRLNTQNGLINQTWKDSSTSFLFEDGQSANWAGGIGALNLQGYAYDALIAAAHLLTQDEQAGSWRQRARDLQELTLQKLWMPDAGFFAQGIDRDDQGNERLINTLTSDSGVLLESNLLKDLAKDRTAPYVQSIVSLIMSDEFMTPAGIRCRARRHAAIPGIIDYHGTYAVWPKETYDICKGFRNHGHHQEAKELEKRLIHAVLTSGEFYEFFYVDLEENAWHDRTVALQHFAQKSPTSQLPIPEPGQAWTISAFMAIAHSMRPQDVPKAAPSATDPTLTPPPPEGHLLEQL